MIIVATSFSKSFGFKIFYVHAKALAFLLFEERFRKVPFSWRIGGDESLIRE